MEEVAEIAQVTARPDRKDCGRREVKDVMRMTIEILKGYEFGDSRSFIPVNYDNLQSWKQLEKEVAEIHAKGGVVDLPGYECQYTEYDSETGTWTTTPPPGSPAAIEAERRTNRNEEQLDFGHYELPSRTRPKWGSPDVGRFGYPIDR